MTTYHGFDNLVSKNVLQQIEDLYYRNISQPVEWHDLILKAIRENRNIQVDIEMFADRGTLNLDRFITIAATCFEKISPYLFQGNQEWSKLTGWFILLHCYLHIINSDTDLHKNNLASFLNEDFQEIFSLIYDDWQNKFETLFAQHGIEQNCNQRTLLQLIILPYISDENLSFGEIIANFKTLKTTLSNKVNSLKREDSSFHNMLDEDLTWLSTDNSFRECIIGAVKIFDLARQIYFTAQGQKIFGFFQRFLDKVTANVVYSITHNDKNYLLEGTLAPIAGAANIEQVEVLPNFDLLISFSRGSFSAAEINEQAAFRSALMLSQFISNCHYYLDSTFVLENTADNLEFVSLVEKQLTFLSPGVEKHISAAPPIKYSSSMEKEKYITGKPLLFDQELVNEITNKFFQLRKVSNETFEGTKIITLLQNEVLFEENDPAVFVYIPCSTGLVGYSSKAQIEFTPYPWLPVGHIGVLQNKGRTATIRAQKTCQLIMIPGHIYLEHWNIIHNNEQLLSILKQSS